MMQGSAKVIEQLNAALSAELSAIVQYMVQAEMCDNWGYHRLGALTKKRAIEEMHHAEGLIERIIFLDGAPEVAIPLKPQIGANVKQHLEIDLKDEIDASAQYNNAVNVCVAEKDDGSRTLFEKMIQDEERHVDFLESQLHSLNEMGIANYLSEQLKNGEGK
jgi:bacterioferritin